MTSKIKVIFLDVDGVLNMSTSGGGLYTLNDKRIKLLETIIIETGAKIVLSSTWRTCSIAYKKLCRKLQYRSIRIFSCTPIIDKYERGLEISRWLENNDYVENYVIIDDNDWNISCHHNDHFVLTDERVGLTIDDVNKAINILNSTNNIDSNHETGTINNFIDTSSILS